MDDEASSLRDQNEPFADFSAIQHLFRTCEGS